MRISSRHPRAASLRTRAHLTREMREGIVAPEGLIAHGRGEAFDYLLGERSSPSARRAEQVAAAWLRAARHPVVSVNGNVAALAANPLARLVRALPTLRTEVNLFHRTPARAAKIAARLRAAGIRSVLGVHPRVRIPNLPSDRALVDRAGIAQADVCLIPLEDGDRTEALRALGIRVISIDLNPLSRTSQQSDLPIVDELTRALEHITRSIRRSKTPAVPGHYRPFDRSRALADATATIERRLRRAMGEAARAPRLERRR